MDLLRSEVRFNAKRLLEDVRRIVREAKEKEKFEITQGIVWDRNCSLWERLS